MDMDAPVLSSRAFKSQSYSNKKIETTTTLDQPVTQTIKRDLNMINKKIQTTLFGEGNYDELAKSWDLWGPLVISLSTASFTTIGTYSDTEEVFTILFLSLWIGPLLITINSILFGAKIKIIQSICLIIYCSSPIMILSIVLFITRLLFHSFFFNLILAIGSLVFTLRSNYGFFSQLVTPDKHILNMYPVFLFYSYISLFVAMS